MGEILVAIGGVAGLVTLGTFVWRLVRRPDPGDVVSEDVISAFKFWQDDYQKIMGDVSLADSWKMFAGDTVVSRAMHKLEGYHSSSQVRLTSEEKQQIENWLGLAELSKPLQAPLFADGGHISRRSTPPPPPRLRFLGRHLPEELQPHKKEILQFLEDGLAELGGKKRKRFLFTQYFSIAIYIGKARLFKFSKTWRRTIR